jgi:hypothetical protein
MELTAVATTETQDRGAGDTAGSMADGGAEQPRHLAADTDYRVEEGEDKSKAGGREGLDDDSKCRDWRRGVDDGL